MDAEDPVGAVTVFGEARRLADEQAAAGALADRHAALVGLGRAFLLLGDADSALTCARRTLATDPTHDGAVGLEVRAMLRARAFRAALDRAEAAVAAVDHPGVETLSALASALFRTQANEQAARVYRRVLLLDPLHAEAHLRLGSGLTAPCRVETHGDEDLRAGVEFARRGEHAAAIAAFQRALVSRPGHPVAHRLLGETLYEQRSAQSMASQSDEFRWLAARLPVPSLAGLPVDQFMPAFASLDASRKRVARRALALFSSRLPRLVTMGGEHDLIGALERTTDAPARTSLRGRRTFDGRVWDDVRGIGGLRAATGIEALDEARGHGFDTLAHEIAHQAHLYALPRVMRARIKEMYENAVAEGRCLDYYAATNDAEYFGQGVEAFVSLAKRPGYEVTHGHTRFELMRVDPALHDLIASLVDYDPLAADRTAERVAVLHACVASAMKAGRFADAVTAAELLPASAERDQLIAHAKAEAARIRAAAPR